MAELRIVVAGAAGRMGRMIVQGDPRGGRADALRARSSARTRPGSATIRARWPVARRAGSPIGTDPLPLMLNADAIIDFSSPAATVELAALAAQARIADVIGTTGLAEEDLDKIDAAARHAPIVRSGNMSLGVNLLAALTRRAAAALGDEYDIEIFEMHHRMKVDAPVGHRADAGRSGRGRARDRAENSFGAGARRRDRRDGARATSASPRLRGGTVVGDHEVIFAGEGERLSLAHHAEDRMLFAYGALKAARWAHGRKPGLYAMADVLGLKEG